MLGTGSFLLLTRGLSDPVISGWIVHIQLISASGIVKPTEPVSPPATLPGVASKVRDRERVRDVVLVGELDGHLLAGGGPRSRSDPNLKFDASTLTDVPSLPPLLLIPNFGNLQNRYLTCSFARSQEPRRGA